MPENKWLQAIIKEKINELQPIKKAGRSLTH
jgi:hypothetical protein